MKLGAEPSAIAEQRLFLAERLGSRALSDIDSGTILVIPSLSFPIEELRKIVGIQHYEERMLFMALLLGKPGVELVYVTSVPIDPAIVDYYLGFLDDPEHARSRLHLFSVDDARPDPLTLKLIEREDVLDQIKARLSNECYALTFNVTEIEWRLMKRLGVTVYGPHPALTWLGSKSGSRHVAQQAGVPVPPGAEDLMSIDEVEQAVQELAKANSGTAVIKLNNGFSGQGNAILSLDSVRSPLHESETIFCAAEESWPSFSRKIAAEGAVVERVVRTPGLASPSAQMRVSPDGSVEVVSTHDQILGGPDNQVYLGCTFPARSKYRMQIQEYGRKVAEVLAQNGVVGSFGIDFVVEPDSDLIYMTEINLRMGGTSHPFYMARFATQGEYDESNGHLIVDGRPRYYVATDNLKSESYKGLKPGQAIEALRDAGLAYDRVAKTGIMLHLLGALSSFGKIGCVALGNSRAEADELFRSLEPCLAELTA